jgi:hypothetical protein
MALLNKKIVLIASAVLAAITLAFALERYFSTSPVRPLGHSEAGHSLGWIGIVLIALTFTYPLPRAPWSNLHKLCGIAGPALICLHPGVHLHALGPVLTLMAMVLVVLSGLMGLIIHYAFAQSLTAQRLGLTQRGLTRTEIEPALHALIADSHARIIANGMGYRYCHIEHDGTLAQITISHVIQDGQQTLLDYENVQHIRSVSRARRPGQIATCPRCHACGSGRQE